MTNYLKSTEKKLSNKKNIIFDLDGVLIDSIKNMEKSWNLTNKKFSLNVSFDKYFKYIVKPFKEILKSLGVKKIFLVQLKKNLEKILSKFT